MTQHAQRLNQSCKPEFCPPCGRSRSALVPHLGSALVALRLWATGSSLVELGVGVDNLSDTRRSDKSALFTYAEPPRIWRLALRTRW